MQSAAVIARHQLIRRDIPVWPFLWRGAAPLAGLLLLALYVLGPFAHGTIESEIQRTIRGQLDAAGFGWVGLSVHGQDAYLSGIEPSAGAAARALAAARASRCQTWLGARPCVAGVSGDFAPPLPVPATAAEPTAVAPAAPAAAATAVAQPRTAAQRCEQSLTSTLAAGQIEFAPGRARISPRSAPLIEALARDLRACPGRVRVEGHTDTVGRGRLNRQLSQARAEAVRAALVRHGIPARRLVAVGYGARQPLADNDNEAGRARNRRIELHVISK
ncbi:MAG: OmpA family protein [Gammaproteobacteria bacterium]|nr:OmpA family protein [Gammaproteobacteria bacterium]